MTGDVRNRAESKSQVTIGILFGATCRFCLPAEQPKTRGHRQSERHE